METLPAADLTATKPGHEVNLPVYLCTAKALRLRCLPAHAWTVGTIRLSAHKPKIAVPEFSHVIRSGNVNSLWRVVLAQYWGVATLPIFPKRKYP